MGKRVLKMPLLKGLCLLKFSVSFGGTGKRNKTPHLGVRLRSIFSMVPGFICSFTHSFIQWHTLNVFSICASCRALVSKGDRILLFLLAGFFSSVPGPSYGHWCVFLWKSTQCILPEWVQMKQKDCTLIDLDQEDAQFTPEELSHLA